MLADKDDYITDGAESFVGVKFVGDSVEGMRRLCNGASLIRRLKQAVSCNFGVGIWLVLRWQLFLPAACVHRTAPALPN